MIKICFVIRDRQSLLLLYKSTARPILEYGFVVWSPWNKKYVNMIEQIQHRFTKLIYGAKGLSYEQCLTELNLHTLTFRRKRQQLIQVFKWLHGHYDYHSLFHTVDYYVTRGNSLKLKTTRARLSLRSRFFTVGGLHDWNSLPNDIVNATSLNIFMSRITRHLFKEWFSYDVIIAA